MHYAFQTGNAWNWRKRQYQPLAKFRMFIHMKTVEVTEKMTFEFLLNKQTHRPIWKMAMTLGIRIVIILCLHEQVKKNDMNIFSGVCHQQLFFIILSKAHCYAAGGSNFICFIFHHKHKNICISFGNIYRSCVS